MIMISILWIMIDLLRRYHLYVISIDRNVFSN